MGARLHQEILLELNADSTEYCPNKEYHNILAVGTYQLDEATQQRLGRLFLYQTEGVQQAAETPECPPEYRLALQHQQDIPGIFDLKWQPSVAGSGKPILGAALADGSLRLFELKQVGG